MNVRVETAIEKITERIIGAAFEVSTILGHGYLEAVYRKALVHELLTRGLDTAEEVVFHVPYKDIRAGTYIADILVNNMVVVELKAVDALNNHHVGQLLNYLKCANLTVGLLLNFGKPRLELRRVLR